MASTTPLRSDAEGSDEEDSRGTSVVGGNGVLTRLNLAMLSVGILSGAGLVAICWAVGGGGSQLSTARFLDAQAAYFPSLHAPANVNFGGWLCLEDWFFSGTSGTEVSTIGEVGQGACLPPLLQGPLEAPWPSEGILVNRLVHSRGEEQTVNIFKAHRAHFITADDLKVLQSMRVSTVRLPMVWAAFADALKDIAPEIYGAFDAHTDSVVIPDPFYKDAIKYVTIPRSMLQQFLEDCTDHGLKVLIDIHAFPGGSSKGTYNGIWPLEPVFWFNSTSIGNSTSNMNGPDAGHLIVQNMIRWVETLPLKAFTAIGGITVMNEPAHLLAGKIDAAQVVLPWLAKAADMFRLSALPARGIKLYMNLIETAFSGDFWNVVVQWWTSTFTDAESTMWAVFDLHHYLAWEGEDEAGSGTKERTDANTDTHFNCDDAMTKVNRVLESLQSQWASTFASNVRGLKSSSEFSLSTAHSAAQACEQLRITGAFLAWQLTSMKRYEIEPFFWTWRMPFGPNFQAAWSYKFHMGREALYPSGSEDPCLAATSGSEPEL